MVPHAYMPAGEPHLSFGRSSRNHLTTVLSFVSSTTSAIAVTAGRRAGGGTFPGGDSKRFIAAAGTGQRNTCHVATKSNEDPRRCITTPTGCVGSSTITKFQGKP